MMRLFLCAARRPMRSIVSLCEQSGYRRFVQKEVIRTIFLQKNLVIYKYKCTFVVKMREERDEGTVSPLIFVKENRTQKNS